MRRALAPIATALLSVAALACGSAKTTSSSTRHTTSYSASTVPSIPATRDGYSKNDADNDFDDTANYRDNPPNDDLEVFAGYGPKAGPAVVHAVSGLVKRYYAVSAAGDAARACSMLSASVAGGLATSQNQPGRSCAAVMAQVLARQHQLLLADEVATMKVIEVHVKGSIGLAVLRFKKSPESNIVIEREGGAWKINALFGSYVT
jgi:hypothetical protein